MHQHQEHRGDPGQMHGIEPVLAGMLDDARHPRQQAGDTKPDHHAHDDADMRENIVGRGEFGGHGPQQARW